MKESVAQTILDIYNVMFIILVCFNVFVLGMVAKILWDRKKAPQKHQGLTILALQRYGV